MTASFHKTDMEAAWKQIVEHLQCRLDVVQRRIKSYPTPIPACDEQFNWLLEQREGMAAELAKVRALSPHLNPESIRRFVDTSAHIDRAMVEEIGAALEGAR